MIYSKEDYFQELQAEELKGIINHIKNVKAIKSHTCEKCGCEIPVGDYYFIYKPVPTKKFWFTWRKRCVDCKPIYYDEVNHYENYDSRISQINLRLDYKS